MKTVHLLGLVLVGAGALGFFFKRPAPEPEREQLSAEAPAQGPALDMPQAELPPNHPPVGGAVDGPSGLAAPGAGATPSLQGEILETIDVEAYTYVRIKTATGEHWAAVNRAALSVGQQINIPRASLMQDFHSKSLNRTFDKIYFGSLGDPAAAAQGAAALPPGSATPPAAPAAQPGVALSEIEIASGALGVRIASLFASPTKYSGKRVRVRGKVMKLTTGIKGKSFLHLQDGTLDAKSQPADLAVTTTAEPAGGSIVTLEGKLATDVDMGFGYKYALLLEDAELVAE